MNYDFASVFEFWPMLAKGFLLTLAVSAVGFVASLIIGTVVGLGRLSHSRFVAGISLAFIEFGRNLPFIVILFVLFFFLPAVEIRLPAFIVGAIALSIHAGAYFAEIVRGAILSVPKGQLDSARAVGMSRGQSYRNVIFPQMMGYFLPAATNQVIMVVKESSILSTITVVELTMAGNIIQGYTYTPIEIFFVISIMYWIVCTSIGRFGLWLEVVLQPHLRERAEVPVTAQEEASHA